MATFHRNPSIVIQKFRTGDSITGVSYTGAAESDVSSSGDWFTYTQEPGDAAAIDGGLIPIPKQVQYPIRHIVSAYAYSPGSASMKLILVEPVSGAEFEIVTFATDTLYFATLDRGYEVPYGWQVKFESDGTAMTGAGFVYIRFEECVNRPW